MNQPNGAFSTEKQDAVRREYNRSAADYEQGWSYYIKATTIEILQCLDLMDTDYFLNAGCGTGYLLNFFDRQISQADGRAGFKFQDVEPGDPATRFRKTFDRGSHR